MTSLDTSSEDLQTVVVSENTDPVTVQQNHFINHKRFFYVLLFTIQDQNCADRQDTNQPAKKWQSRMLLLLSRTHIPHTSILT